jgi:GNAT superfamily N-acetyltransferase
MEMARENYSDVMYELDDLHQRHHKEVDLFGLPLEVHRELYLNSERLDTGRLYTIRNQSKLVGYSMFFIFAHGHHKSSIHAKQDVLFIDKDYRGIGLKFMRYFENQLKKDGVNFIHQAVPKINDWSPILRRKGYRELETIYTKEL